MGRANTYPLTTIPETRSPTPTLTRKTLAVLAQALQVRRRVSIFGLRVSVFGSGVSGLNFRLLGIGSPSGHRVLEFWGEDLRKEGVEAHGVLGFGFRFSGVFWVLGFGFRFSGVDFLFAVLGIRG